MFAHVYNDTWTSYTCMMFYTMWK